MLKVLARADRVTLKGHMHHFSSESLEQVQVWLSQGMTWTRTDIRCYQTDEVSAGRMDTMGNGYYHAIGFGCILEHVEDWLENTAGHPSESLAKEVEQRLIDFFDHEDLANITLQSAEEARPDYLVILLATTNATQARYWRIGKLPLECPIPLDELLSTWLAVIETEALSQAQYDWGKVRAAARALGIRLPPGRLIYISDWD
jgi:hypothetical protein